MACLLLTVKTQANNHVNGIGSIYFVNVRSLWGVCNWYSYKYFTGVEMCHQVSSYAFNNNNAHRRHSTPFNANTHTPQNIHWETACLQALQWLSVTITHSTLCVCVCFVCVRESLCLVSSRGSWVPAKVYGHFWKSNKAAEPSFPRGRCRRGEESFLCCSAVLSFPPANHMFYISVTDVLFCCVC